MISLRICPNNRSASASETVDSYRSIKNNLFSIDYKLGSLYGFACDLDNGFVCGEAILPKSDGCRSSALNKYIDPSYSFRNTENNFQTLITINYIDGKIRLYSKISWLALLTVVSVVSLSMSYQGVFSMSIKKLSYTAALLTGTLLTSSVINCVNAKEIAIYRWVDMDNIVHFSEHLPADDEYKEFSTISSYQALSKAERKVIAEQDEAKQKIADKEKQQDDIMAKNKATFDKNCKAALFNIKMLSSLDEIHISEEKSDGTIGNRPLTSAEKEEKLALSKKHEGLYCSK